MNNSLDILFLPAQDVRPKVSSLFFFGKPFSCAPLPPPSPPPKKRKKNSLPARNTIGLRNSLRSRTRSCGFSRCTRRTQLHRAVYSSIHEWKGGGKKSRSTTTISRVYDRSARGEIEKKRPWQARVFVVLLFRSHVRLFAMWKFLRNARSRSRN